MISTFSAQYRDWPPTPGQGTPASSRIRVGIACGEVFYGNVGYAGRSDFTALGNAVNLASRLQDLNRTTGTTILIDEETRAGLQESDPRSVRWSRSRCGDSPVPPPCMAPDAPQPRSRNAPGKSSGGTPPFLTGRQAMVGIPAVGFCG